MRAFRKTIISAVFGALTGLCPQPSSAADRASVVELGNALTAEMTSYLQRSRTDLAALAKWLEPLEKWPAIRREDCNKDPRCKLNLNVMPVLHKKFRIYLALSSGKDSLDWRLWDLNVGGNPDLHMPLSGPRAERQTPLSPAETLIAQRDLIQFFDGRALSEEEQDAYEIEFETDAPAAIPGVIEDYIAILRRKIPLMMNLKREQAQDREILKALEDSRSIKNPIDRVTRAFLIYDEGWRHYRQVRLTKFHRENLTRVWALADQVRPLLYINGPKVTPAMVRAAYTRSADDSRRLQAKVDATFGRLSHPDINPTDEIEWLMDYPAIVERTLAAKPELTQVAEEVRRSIDRERLIWRSAIYAAIMVPSVLMAPPVAAAVGVAGRAGLWMTGVGGATAMTVQSYKAYETKYEQYMARYHSEAFEPGWTSSDDLLASRTNLMISSFYIFWCLGPPTGTASLLKKLIH